MYDSARLDAVFSALADPTRRSILARLSTGSATVSELAAPFEMAQPTISRHLKVLEDAGLIEQGRDAQRRPRTLVVGGPLAEADAWLLPFRAQWEARFDRLASFLHAAAEGPPVPGPTPKSKSTSTQVGRARSGAAPKKRKR